MFSSCFWVQGCLSPQVSGFRAHIEVKPDAVPRVSQPYPLSPFDQMRMDFHEDERVAIGKGEWLGPDDRATWASSGFVVDQVR